MHFILTFVTLGLMSFTALGAPNGDMSKCKAFLDSINALASKPYTQTDLRQQLSHLNKGETEAFTLAGNILGLIKKQAFTDSLSLAPTHLQFTVPLSTSLKDFQTSLDLRDENNRNQFYKHPFSKITVSGDLSFIVFELGEGLRAKSGNGPVIAQLDAEGNVRFITSLFNLERGGFASFSQFIFNENILRITHKKGLSKETMVTDIRFFLLGKSGVTEMASLAKTLGIKILQVNPLSDNLYYLTAKSNQVGFINPVEREMVVQFDPRYPEETKVLFERENDRVMFSELYRFMNPVNSGRIDYIGINEGYNFVEIVTKSTSMMPANTYLLNKKEKRVTIADVLTKVTDGSKHIRVVNAPSEKMIVRATLGLDKKLSTQVSMLDPISSIVLKKWTIPGDHLRGQLYKIKDGYVLLSTSINDMVIYRLNEDGTHEMIADKLAYMPFIDIKNNVFIGITQVKNGASPNIRIIPVNSTIQENNNSTAKN